MFSLYLDERERERGEEKVCSILREKRGDNQTTKRSAATNSNECLRRKSGIWGKVLFFLNCTHQFRRMFKKEERFRILAVEFHRKIKMA